MKRKHALAFALAAILSAPVLAESAGDGAGAGGPGSGSPGGVSAGSSGASSPLAATPNSAMAGTVASSSPGMMVPGAIADTGTALAVAPNTAILGGPGAAVVTHHWVNVPANVEHRADFQRWMHLR